MAALSKAAKGILAIRTDARDARWRASAQAACDEALLDARFADAEALAGAVGPTLRRQQDLARLGLGLPLAADAHPEAQRAARALAGPDPTLVAGMKLSDPRRRALELHWELQAGQDDLARARAPRRLPSGDHRMWWAGAIELLAGEEDAASYSLMDAPGEGGRWAKDLRGWDEPSRPAAKYASARQQGDRCLAARLFRPEFVKDAQAGHVAAMMSVCEGHRGEAERHAAAVVDPFDRVLWRVRRGLVEPGPGWEAVARAAPAAGWRGVAAPLAWLRAADGWRKAGDARRAQEALAQAGPRAESFATELEAARQAAPSWPSVEELGRLVVEKGIAAAFAALGRDAPVDLAAGVLSSLEILIEGAPERARRELALLSGIEDPALGAAIALRALPLVGASWLDGILGAMPEHQASLTLAGVMNASALDGPGLYRVAREAGLDRPMVLFLAATRLESDAIRRLSDAIDVRGDPGGGRPSADELRVALAEAVIPDRTGFLPKGLLAGIAGRPGPWSDHAHLLLTNRARPPTSPPDPRIAPAIRENRPVFVATAPAFLAMRARLAALDDATDELYEAVMEEERSAPEMPRRTVTDAERKKKAALRKSQKKARKAGRKR